MAHQEFGYQLATKITENLKELSIIERPAHFEGRQIILSLQPCQKLKPTPEQKKDLQ
jgi:translation initiation factor IF-3